MNYDLIVNQFNKLQLFSNEMKYDVCN